MLSLAHAWLLAVVKRIAAGEIIIGTVGRASRQYSYRVQSNLDRAQ